MSRSFDEHLAQADWTKQSKLDMPGVPQAEAERIVRSAGGTLPKPKPDPKSLLDRLRRS